LKKLANLWLQQHLRILW